MKPFYAITDRKDRYWNGKLPELQAGRSGKVHHRVMAWKPTLGYQQYTWSRESTAVKRLSGYAYLREVRPELPELYVAKFSYPPPQLESIKSVVGLSDIERAYARLYYHFGATVAEDYQRVFEDIDPRYTHMIIKKIKKSGYSPKYSYGNGRFQLYLHPR
jgi:hypothetical protein